MIHHADKHYISCTVKQALVNKQDENNNFKFFDTKAAVP